jgi:glutamate formiminotransferase
MKPRLVESVPNISEGRSSSVINAIAQAARGEGRYVLDVDSDVDHNRSVITIVGEPTMVAVGIDHLVEE